MDYDSPGSNINYTRGFRKRFRSKECGSTLDVSEGGRDRQVVFFPQVPNVPGFFSLFCGSPGT